VRQPRRVRRFAKARSRFTPRGNNKTFVASLPRSRSRQRATCFHRKVRTLPSYYSSYSILDMPTSNWQTSLAPKFTWLGAKH
jgi:hypothetical protein